MPSCSMPAFIYGQWKGEGHGGYQSSRAHRALTRVLIDSAFESANMKNMACMPVNNTTCHTGMVVTTSLHGRLSFTASWVPVWSHQHAAALLRPALGECAAPCAPRSSCPRYRSSLYGYSPSPGITGVNSASPCVLTSQRQASGTDDGVTKPMGPNWGGCAVGSRCPRRTWRCGSGWRPWGPPTPCPRSCPPPSTSASPATSGRASRPGAFNPSSTTSRTTSEWRGLPAARALRGAWRHLRALRWRCSWCRCTVGRCWRLQHGPRGGLQPSPT
jgi:hypothetical protein